MQGKEMEETLEEAIERELPSPHTDKRAIWAVGEEEAITKKVDKNVIIIENTSLINGAMT